MTKQESIGKPKANKKNWHKSEPGVRPGRTTKLAHVVELPGESIGANCRIENMVSRMTQLGNDQLLTAQRQGLFITLQHSIGHQSIQRMAGEKRQQLTCSDIRGQLTGSVAISSISGQVLQRKKYRGLTRKQVIKIKGKLAWFKRQLTILETERSITTEAAGLLRADIKERLENAHRLAVPREVDKAEAEQLKLAGRDLLKQINSVRAIRNRLRSSARRARSTKGLHLISDFKIIPPVIHVGEGEAARISFILKEPAKDITWFILAHEGTGPTDMREFGVRDLHSGYKYAIWDGTFQGSRNVPPDTGTYRVNLWVTGKGGTEEKVSDQIRVENPARETVLPRVASGIALQSLMFDGKVAVLKDKKGNEIRARALSGLKPKNRHNHQHKDYTKPRYQQDPYHGPIPEGTYMIRVNEAQHPEMKRGKLRYKARSTARAWGPFRVELHPVNIKVKGRSGFFLHLDVGSDGTAGCIGIQPGDEGKFNQIMSLISLSGSDLPVIVKYP